MHEAATEQQSTQSNGTSLQDPAQPGSPTAPVSDVSLARAVAEAVRTVPGVTDLSPGLAALAATYGASQRVVGIVVHHLSPDEVVLEIHVILDQAHCEEAAAHADADSAALASEGILTGVASRIRAAARETVEHVPQLVLVRADVLIDDLC